MNECRGHLIDLKVDADSVRVKLDKLVVGQSLIQRLVSLSDHAIHVSSFIALLVQFESVIHINHAVERLMHKFRE